MPVLAVPGDSILEKVPLEYLSGVQFEDIIVCQLLQWLVFSHPDAKR